MSPARRGAGVLHRLFFSAPGAGAPGGIRTDLRCQRSRQTEDNEQLYRSSRAFLIFDLVVVILLFAMIFRYLPDAKLAWRVVWIGATLTAVLFAVGKFVLGLYLGSGGAGSAYGAPSSLITLLLWIYYAAQILLFGAEFTQVYANTYGTRVEPQEHAVKVVTMEKVVSN
jgi:uncharacterized BrkB/YihY/UPF0761 family membrane protein